MGSGELILGMRAFPRESGDMDIGTARTLQELVDRVGRVDRVGIEERVAKYGTRSIKKASKVFGLKMAVSMVDLTTLEGKDTRGKVESLCHKALRPHEGILPTAAVCVYPAMVKYAARLVKGTPVKIASVATAFPSGQAPLATRLAEVKSAVKDGADEIDMVINRGAFNSRNQRAGNLRQHPRRVVPRDGSPASRRFHQDLHR